MHFLSRIRLALGRHIQWEQNQNVLDLSKAVHDLHYQVSNLTGQTIFDPADYQKLTAPTTIRSQDTDKLYCKAGSAMAVGDLVSFTNDGAGKVTANKSSTYARGHVLEYYATGHVLVALAGVLTKSGGGIIVGGQYFLHSTIAGEVNITTGIHYVGFGITPTEIYFNPKY